MWKSFAVLWCAVWNVWLGKIIPAGFTHSSFSLQWCWLGLGTPQLTGESHASRLCSSQSASTATSGTCYIENVFLCVLQVFSVKSIHLSEKRMLWQNGQQILPTPHGWKVRKQFRVRSKLPRCCCGVISLRLLLRSHDMPAGCSHLFKMFLWHNWIPGDFLPRSFEEAQPCVCLSSSSLPASHPGCRVTGSVTWCVKTVHVSFQIHMRWFMMMCPEKTPTPTQVCELYFIFLIPHIQFQASCFWSRPLSLLSSRLKVTVWLI